MPEPSISIPVLAHRVFGTRLRAVTLRLARQRRPSLGSPLTIDPKWLWHALPLPLPFMRQIVTLAPAVDQAHGCRRSVEEVRAFFTPDPSLAYTTGTTLEEIWGPVGLAFALEDVVDEMIDSDLADFLPGDTRISHPPIIRLSRPNRLNVFFVRELGGAWGFAVRLPTGSALVLAERDELAATPERWRREMITLAHEIGHVFGLPHMPGGHNLMYGHGTLEHSVDLERPQWRIAQRFAEDFPV